MWSFTATVIPEPCVIKVVSNRNTFRSLRIPETFGRLFVYGQCQLFFSSLVAFAAPASAGPSLTTQKEGRDDRHGSLPPEGHSHQFILNLELFIDAYGKKCPFAAAGLPARKHILS